MFLYVVIHARFGRDERATFLANDADGALYQAEKSGLNVKAVWAFRDFPERGIS